MKKIYKNAVFLLIVTIALNISIGLDNKHILRLGISEVEAAQPWETLEYYKLFYRIPHNSNYIKSAYVIKTYIVKETDSSLTVYADWGLSKYNEDDIYGSTDKRTSSIDDYSANIDKTKYNYKIKLNKASGRVDNSIGYVDFEFVLLRQLKNIDPALTLNQPTSNSPLHPINYGIRRIV